MMQLKFLKRHSHDATSTKKLPKLEDILGCVSKYKLDEPDTAVAKVEKKKPEKQFLKRTASDI